VVSIRKNLTDPKPLNVTAYISTHINKDRQPDFDYNSLFMEAHFRNRVQQGLVKRELIDPPLHHLHKYSLIHK